MAAFINLYNVTNHVCQKNFLIVNNDAGAVLGIHQAHTNTQEHSLQFIHLGISTLLLLQSLVDQFDRKTILKNLTTQPESDHDII